jgi:hypothetical protein
MSHPLLSNTKNKQPLFSSKQLAVSEYLLILQPHEDLYNKILDIKRSFADTYDCPMAAFLKPHLTLIKFMQFEMQQAIWRFSIAHHLPECENKEPHSTIGKITKTSTTIAEV